jgi:hypothetical protein
VTRDELKQQIRDAFADVQRPGNWALRGSNEGEEPYLVERAFSDKSDWRDLEAAFLDRAPDGYGSALSFLSDEAFRYFLPAYLLADVDDSLESVNPVFYLCHGLDDKMHSQPVNPRRYGARTWFEERRYRFAVFTAAEARAILGYLRYKADREAFDRTLIEPAIRNFWGARAVE